MKISVIIPVYDVEKYIRKCLESAINQTYKNLKIIVVNDGTKDNSMKIVEEYLGDKRIKIINKKNEGVALARNSGLKEATGDYISFVDSDDWLERNLYEKLVNKLENEDILIFNYNEYNERNERLKKNILKISKLREIEENSKVLLLGILNGECWNKIYRREFLEDKALIFNKNKIYEDTLWGLKTSYNASKIKLVDISGYFYRVNRNGSLVTHGKEEIKSIEVEKIIDELNKFLENNKVNKIEKFHLELFKMNLKCFLENDIAFVKLEEKVEEYLRLEKNKIEIYVLKKIFHKILKSGSIKGIKLINFSFWYNGIYNLRILKRIIKNFN